MATTASDGSYTLNDVPLDNAQVIRAVPASGWWESTAGGSAASVMVSDDAPDASGVDFGQWQPITGVSTSNVTFSEGQSLAGAIATATNSATPPYSNWNSYYSGSLTLNGGSAGNWNLDFSASNGTAEPSGSITLSSGTYSATVSITESNDGQSFTASSSFTLTIVKEPITARGTTLTAATGNPWTGTIASFTDPDPNAQSGNYTATINYGDGTPNSTGTVSSDNFGGFIVTDNHIFTTDGTFSPVVTLTDSADGGKTATATGTASVSLAPISVTAPDLQMQEGQAYSGGIATLTDYAGTYATGNYTASLTINGSPYGGLTLSALGNGVYSVQVSDIPILPVGTYSGILNISETGATSTTSASPADLFSIDALQTLR